MSLDKFVFSVMFCLGVNDKTLKNILVFEKNVLYLSL